jgi:hypothetical protein
MLQTGHACEHLIMETRCPRCHTLNNDIARFCARCGLLLEADADGVSPAGRLQHPKPAPVPEGYEQCQEAADLYYRLES